MAQTRVIDPNAIEWAGPVAEKADREERKDETNIVQGVASTRGSNASAAVNESKLPYIPRQEAAQTTTLETQASRLTRGVPLDKDERKELGDLVSGVSRFDALHSGFRDGYAGSILDTLGDAENSLQSRFASLGTPGQSLWWQSKNFTDMLERNKYFGTSLTEGEKQAWAATTVTPGMDPRIVKANIARRRAIASTALGRTLDTFRAGDYRPEQLRTIVGQKVFDRYANPKSRKRQDAADARELDGILAEVGIKDVSPDAAGVAGENLKAPRLSDEGSRAITAFVRGTEGLTPEAYTNKLLDMYEAEGLSDPQDRDAAFRATLPAARTFFEGLTPEQRRAVGPGLNYSRADADAQASAGIGDVALQALTNTPESAANLVEGIAALPVDALVSLVNGERYGALRSTTDLAAELAGAAVGGGSGPTMQALGGMLSDNYGSVDGFKRAVAKDPLAVAGDISLLLTGGGSAAARLPGVAGRAGNVARTAGRVVDPLSALVAGVENLPRAIEAIPQALKNTPGAIAGHALGVTTGVPGGQGYRRAASAGFERGLEGPTARSERFLDQMRGGDPSEVVGRVEDAVRNMQAEASRAYDSGMIDTRSDATVLDFADIDRTLDGLRDRAFYNGQVKNQRAANAFERVSELVNDWRALDPDQFHTPIGMDALKQRIGDISDDFRQNNDRRAAGIVEGVYHAARRSIARQAKTYDNTMRQYEKAQGLLRQIKNTFSVNPTASVDTQLRKLQSLMRNNANTNYGYRAELGRLLEERGGVGIMDDLAAQSISSAMPRGLTGAGAGTLAAGAGAGAAVQMMNPLAPATMLLNPANAMALPLMSPRLMGETSYYTGAGAGLAARGVRAGYEALEPTLEALHRKYQQHPTAALLAGRAGSMLEQGAEATDAESALGGLPRQITLPKAPEGAPDAPEALSLPPGASIDEVTGEIVLEDGTRIPLPKMAAGGAVRRGWGDTARDVAKGATGAWNDEIEAAVRAGAAGDPGAYRREVNAIREQQRQAYEAAPYASLGWEMAGAVAPSLVARRPAGMNRTLARLSSKYPATSAFMSGSRLPAPLRAMLPGAGLDAAMAALYAAGEADTVGDIPSKMASEVPEAMVMYGLMGSAGGGLKRLYNKYTGRRR